MIFKLFAVAMALTLVVVPASATAQVSAGEVAVVEMILSSNGAPVSRFLVDIEPKSAMPKDVFYKKVCALATELAVFLSQLGYNPEMGMEGMHFQTEDLRGIERVANGWMAGVKVTRVELQRLASGSWIHELMLMGQRHEGRQAPSVILQSCAGKSHSRSERTSPMWEYYYE